MWVRSALLTPTRFSSTLNNAATSQLLLGLPTRTMTVPRRWRIWAVAAASLPGDLTTSDNDSPSGRGSPTSSASGIWIVFREECCVTSRTPKSPRFFPGAGRAIAIARSLGVQSRASSMFLLLSGDSQRAISPALGMNGVSSRNCACRHSRLMVASSSSSFRPRSPEASP